MIFPWLLLVAVLALVVVLVIDISIAVANRATYGRVHPRRSRRIVIGLTLLLFAIAMAWGLLILPD